MKGDYQFFEYFEDGITSPTLSIQNPFATLEDLLYTVHTGSVEEKLIDRTYYPTRVSSLDFLVSIDKDPERIKEAFENKDLKFMHSYIGGNPFSRAVEIENIISINEVMKGISEMDEEEWKSIAEHINLKDIIK